jgi:hypothetical protein
MVVRKSSPGSLRDPTSPYGRGEAAASALEIGSDSGNPYRTSSRIAQSSPSSVNEYIRPPISWRTIWIE